MLTFRLSRLALAVLASLIIVVFSATQTMNVQGQDNTPAASATLAGPPPTNTPHPTRTPAPTATPSPTPQPAAVPGRLCSTCSRIRLRATAGTAGDVLDFLDSTSTLTIQGRSADNKWLRVKVIASGTVGWIATQYVRTNSGQALDEAAVAALPLLGVAVEATPLPAGSLGGVSAAGLPTWLTGVTAHARQIFQKGQSLGNRANVFSKIGDSITASSYFLEPFGRGQYDLGAYNNLSAAINYFSAVDARAGNSFVNVSLAARKGWSAFHVLESRTNPDPTCAFDPYLLCEYKLVKPSIALIMMGTNDSGSGSADVFAGNLQQIVQMSIDNGVIPVLSTIPPRRINAEQIARVAAFNEVIHNIARANDIPLWDYFTIMDAAPNGGIGPDGLHPSVPPDGATGRFNEENLQYGYTIRNLMALQVLDALWRNVLS